MAHERATSIGTQRGEQLVYGPGTGRFPEPLPLIYGFEQPAYGSVEEADQAARLRSVLNTVAGTRSSTSDFLRTNPDAQTLAELLRANPLGGPRGSRAPQPAPQIPRQRPFASMEGDPMSAARENEIARMIGGASMTPDERAAIAGSMAGGTETDYEQTSGAELGELIRMWMMVAGRLGLDDEQALEQLLGRSQ